VLLTVGLALVALGLPLHGGSITARIQNPQNRGLPRISGMALSGQVLKASTGSWTGSPTRFVYTWKHCDRTSTSRCTTIRLAHAPTLTLTARDVGNRIRVAVTASNSSGGATAQSAATGLVRTIAVTLSSAGNDSSCARGNKPTPCATFARAYQLARCGDIVGVMPGDYPPQTILYDSRKSCADAPVLFQPLDGNRERPQPQLRPHTHRLHRTRVGQQHHERRRGLRG